MDNTNKDCAVLSLIQSLSNKLVRKQNTTQQDVSCDEYWHVYTDTKMFMTSYNKFKQKIVFSPSLICMALHHTLDKRCRWHNDIFFCAINRHK